MTFGSMQHTHGLQTFNMFSHMCIVRYNSDDRVNNNVNTVLCYYAEYTMTV